MPTEMTLAYLTSVYPRATDTFVRNEVFELRQRGHRVRTFSIRRVDGSQLVSDSLRKESATTTYILPGRLLRIPLATLMLFFRSPSRFWRASRLALRTRPPGFKGFLWQIAYLLEAAFLADCMLRDGIQHLHNHIGESSASVAMLASELSGIPYSLTIHGPYLFRAPERWALGTKIIRSSFTACISDFTKSQCMIDVPYPRWSRLHVIRCGPDPSFLDSEPPPNEAPQRLVWVGRICEEKGVPILMEAVERLADQLAAFELVLVGDGPLRPSIEAAIEGRGLRDFVSISGWLDSQKVRDQIVAARAMVLPSFAEGLPVVLMEALALCRPVISTYVAGIPELVEPGVNGWLVPAGSVDHLTQAMREALEAPLDRLEAMGRAGREAVRRLHDVRIEVGKLETLIERRVRS